MSPWLWLNHAKSILRVFAQTASTDFFGPRSRKPRQLMKWLFPHTHTSNSINHRMSFSIDPWQNHGKQLACKFPKKIPNRQTKSVSSRRSASQDMSWWIRAIRCIWIYLNHFDSSHASKVQLLSKESSTAQRITRCLLALERNPGQRRVPQLHWHMFCCDWYKGLFTRSYCQGLFWSFTMPNCGRIGCDTVQ